LDFILQLGKYLSEWSEVYCSNILCTSKHWEKKQTTSVIGLVLHVEGQIKQTGRNTGYWIIKTVTWT